MNSEIKYLKYIEYLFILLQVKFTPNSASCNAQNVPLDQVISYIYAEKRRPELIPEDLHRHYIQTMQERVHPEVQRHLEDFR